MKDTTYTYHYDAGHGWLAVDFDDLLALNIAQDISSYSYMRRGNTVFLEEDCDMSIFFNAFQSEFGRKPKYTNEGDSDWIRDLPYYDATAFVNHVRIRVGNLESEMDGARDESYIAQLKNGIDDLYTFLSDVGEL